MILNVKLILNYRVASAFCSRAQVTGNGLSDVNPIGDACVRVMLCNHSF